MTLYTAWFDYVMPSVPGAMNGVVTQAIRRAVIEFCRLSLACRHTPSAINIVGATSTYTITPPAGTQVQDFMDVKVNGIDIDARSNEWLDLRVKDWRTTATGPARAWRSPGTNQIQIVPTPSESITGGLVVECALKPTEASTECPDWIFNDYVEAIKWGALERLCAMPRAPWRSGELYNEAKREFASWCEAASARAMQGGTRAPLRSSTNF